MFIIGYDIGLIIATSWWN